MNVETQLSDRQESERLLALVRDLAPNDRQLVMLYLEGFDGTDMASITGLSPSNVATKINRIKTLLQQRFEGAK